MEVKNELAKTSEDLQLVKKQLTISFEKDFPKYIKKAKAKFGRELDKLYVNAEIDNPELYYGKNKINIIDIENYLCSSLTNYYGIKPKYTATHISLASKFFWDVVNRLNAKGIYFVPTIELFCIMLGISTVTFKEYQTTGDDEMKNAIELVLDRFKAYYIQRGMTRELDNQMTIFNLKANYGMKDTEAPINIGNAVFASVDKDYDKRVQEKFGISMDDIDFSFDD